MKSIQLNKESTAGNENALAKIERLENFNAILKDRFRIDLLKAVHPNFRQNFVENFSNSLPKNCWDANACDNQLRITDDKCLTVSWCSEKKGCSTVFAKHPFPTCSSGIFYYEIKILRMKGNTMFSIGLASKAMPLDDCVGNHWDSYGYERDGGFRISRSVWLNEDRYAFSRGDTIGCGVNFASRRIIFTHNRRQLDTSDLFLSPCSVGPWFPSGLHEISCRFRVVPFFRHFLIFVQPWFPCISLSDDTKIVANFGPDFKFDPTKIMALSNSRETNFWDADACDNGLKITDNKKLTVLYNEEKTHWLTVFAKHSIMVPNYADFFYFEIKVKNMNKGVLFGFTTKKIHGDGEMYGNAWYSDGIFGYLSDGHLWTSGSGVPCSKFAAGSVVGCGINLNNRQLIFTKNGHRLDDDDYRVSSSVCPLFPFVTLFAVGEKIEANFGPKFEFNFENI
ncbi:hypothetical protein niasHS_008087 [Heterodera schachtii]|uniref:B30.2/SPRY domain-containing protein n=1 Tax=Heterodera schachtii TaxID=97005 RepID=A0ABD2J7L2_HETSC